MLDLSYFQNQNSNVQAFYSSGSWVTWRKPRGAKMVTFFVVGGAGGGGGGYQAASGAISGGGAGGNGGVSRLIIQASLLPDILYVYCGSGGTGGIGGATPSAGGNGSSSFVCLIPDFSSVSNIVLASGIVVAQGGTPGSTVTGATVAGETAITAANSIFINLGIFNSAPGTNGTGGSTGGGTNIGANIFTVGCSGGGTGNGGYYSAASYPFFTYPVPSINTNGRDGVIIYKPVLFFYGGTGGGGGTNGGKGGNGAFGCSGGGGGAGTASAGNGGNGGNGLVIITTSF